MDISESALRAVYYEDDLDQFEDYAPTLEKILLFKSDSVHIAHAKTEDELNALMKTRPHVVFCDNDHGLSQKGPREGIIAISKLKPRFPDSLFCLLTSKGVQTQSFGSYTPNPDLVISKSSLAAPKYVEYLGEKIRRMIRRSPLRSTELSINLKEEGPNHSTRGVSLTKEELHSIVEQVIDADGVQVLASELQSAALEPISGGFSGAGVYSLYMTRADGRANVPAVLKVSQRVQAVQELENFQKFVKWRLPYLWRVDLLGTGHTQQFGAVCYSFASGGGDRPLPVNDYIRRGDVDVIDKVLGSVLHSNNQTWYSEQRPSGLDIREYFSQDRFYRTSSKREVLERYFYSYLVDSLKDSGVDVVEGDLFVHFDGIKYPKLDELIFAHRWGRVTECVCHGDMNGNNLLYAGGDAPVVFIDFQDTGFCHLFRDFVSFEASIRIEHRVERSEGESDLDLFRQYLAMERKLAASNWTVLNPDLGYAYWASKVRNTAHQNFENESLALYLVANIVHTVWIFERAAKWAVHKRLRMAATILESALALQRLSEKGKPK